jgi:hypothetical protein
MQTHDLLAEGLLITIYASAALPDRVVSEGLRGCVRRHTLRYYFYVLAFCLFSALPALAVGPGDVGQESNRDCLPGNSRLHLGAYPALEHYLYPAKLKE